MDKQENRIRNIALTIAFTLVSLMVIVFLLDKTFHLKLFEYGVLPRQPIGLIGVLTSPFIHSTKDFSHIFNNSIPMFVLTALLFYTYRTVAGKVFVSIYLLTGILVWIFGRSSYHIGMSGVIYGLTSFLIISGFLRKDLRTVSLSLLVIFLYGSLIWGVFPIDPSVSWEGHFFGFLSGIVLAVVFRKAPPQPQKYFYELQDELQVEEEYEYPYWLENTHTEKENQQEQTKDDISVTIRYTYKPNENNKL
jgi:membrane associated rhomboid family serine protease